MNDTNKTDPAARPPRNSAAAPAKAGAKRTKPAPPQEAADGPAASGGQSQGKGSPGSAAQGKGASGQKPQAAQQNAQAQPKRPAPQGGNTPNQPSGQNQGAQKPHGNGGPQSSPNPPGGPGRQGHQNQGSQKPQGAANPQNPQGQTGGNAGPGPRKPKPEITIRPAARPARMRTRHWGVLTSFLCIALLPLALVINYLFFVAVDQYSSSAGFTVRSEEQGSASELLGGLTQFAGSGIGADNDVLYEFIQSQEIVEAVDTRLDLRSHYAVPWNADPLFSLPPDATVEDMVDHWLRVVRISYDRGPGLIDLQVLAFDAEMAQSIAFAILDESNARVNDLNTQARADAMRYANEDLDTAVEQLKGAREALTRFRVRTQIVDPEADIQGRMGVLNNLQQQLAQALIDFDLLLDTTSNSNDPRLVQARRRIDVIRERIAGERETLATDGGTAGQTDYPSLISEFESLSTDREVAEQSYRAALTALDVARANAQRQSRYLAVFVRPTRAYSSEYPQRFVLTGLAALFLLLTWGVLVLIYYSIRDRS